MMNENRFQKKKKKNRNVKDWENLESELLKEAQRIPRRWPEGYFHPRYSLSAEVMAVAVCLGKERSHG